MNQCSVLNSEKVKISKSVKQNSQDLASARILHCQAMDGAVLSDDSPCVDANDVVAGEGFGYCSKCLVVKCGLVIGRHDDGTVDDEKIGVGGRQTLTVADDWLIHRERQQPVGLAVGSAQLLQLVFKCNEIVVLLVIGKGGGYI